MQTIKKTIKGWANNSDLFFSQNSKNDLFIKNLSDYVKTELRGYKRLNSFSTLRDKKASKKVIIYGWVWNGSWASPTKEIHSIYYK